MISQIEPQTTTQNTPLSVVFAVNSTNFLTNITVRATASNENVPGLVSALTVSGNGTTNNYRTLQITPGLNLPSALTNVNGTATITLAVSDLLTTNFISFPLTVLVQNVGPSIVGLADTNTAANVSLAVDFTVVDPDTLPADLVTTATATPDLGAVAVTGKGASRQFTFIPNGTAGETTVTVSVSDGALSASTTFKITVTGAVLPPVISTIANQFANENSSPAVSFTVASSTATAPTVTAVSDNPRLVSGVAIVKNATDYTATITLVPYANSDRFGPAVITITAGNEVGSTTTSFTLTVRDVEFTPVLGAIADRTVFANETVAIPLVVSDPDTAISNLFVTATSSNSSLVRNVTFANDGTTIVATVNLNADQTGTSTETILVSDNVNTVSQTFVLTVIAAPAPVISTIGSQSTPEDVPLNVSFTVTNGAGAKVTATADNPSLVSAVEVVNNITNYTATVRLVPNANTELFGTANITITASNASGTNSTSFRLVNVFAVEDAPILSAIADRTNAATAVIRIPLTVSDVDTAIEDLFFSATRSNANLVQSVTFDNDGTNVVANVNLVAGQIGTSTVTISASDLLNTVSQTFNLTITSGTVIRPTLVVELDGNSLRITFTGAPNAQYVIQSTTNFSTWVDVTTISTGDSGNGEFETEITTTSAPTFYRAQAR